MDVCPAILAENSKIFNIEKICGFVKRVGDFQHPVWH